MYNTYINIILEAKLDYNVQQVLELACAAQRHNNDYVKSNEVMYSDDGKAMGYKYSNKMLMLFTLDSNRRNEVNIEYLPPVLAVAEEDKIKTEDIRNYYRRLMFSVMAQPDNNFLQEIHSLLNKEVMNESKIGFIACLPSTYERDRQRNIVNKILRECENNYLAIPDTKLTGMTANIIDCSRSKNFDAFNVLATINNKVVTWFSRIPIKEGDIEILSAKVKANGTHWLSKKPETRLNYVKVKK
jgi:hypothetical protein